MQRHSHINSRALPLVAVLWGIVCVVLAQETVRIDGTVTDADGKALAGVTLSFSMRRDDQWERVNLESDETGKITGTATFEDEPPWLHISAPQDVALVPVLFEGDIEKVKNGYRFKPDEEGNVRFTLGFDEAPARVAGKVTGPDGEPVPDATVTLYRHHDPHVAPPVGLLAIFNDLRTVSATTGPDGGFGVAVLGGQHFVNAVTTPSGSLLYWDRRSGGNRTAFPASGETVPLAINLSQGGRFELRVCDQDGNAVPGAVATAGRYRAGGAGLAPPASTDGTIASGGLPPGLHKLHVFPPEEAALAPVTMPVRIEAGKVSTGTAVLPPSATLAVSATYEDGKPAADIAFQGDRVTDAEGQLMIEGLAGGDVEFSLDSRKHPMLRIEGADAKGKLTTRVVNGGSFVLPITVRPLRTITVKGKVTGPDGKGVAGVDVSATGSGDRRQVDDRPEPVKTDAEGAYVIEGVYPGTVRLGVNPPEDMPVSVDPQKLTVADVEEGSTVTKDVALQRASLLRVRLLDADGKPLTNSYVSLTDVLVRGKKRDEKGVSGGWFWGGAGRSDEDGWLVLRLPHRDFKEGDRRIVEAKKHDGLPQWKPSRIDLSPTNGEMIEAELRQQPTQTVSGVVTGKDGKPVYGARVRLVTQERYKTWGMRALGSRLESITDEDGRFEIENVPGDEYWFAAVLPSDRHLNLAEIAPVKLRVQTGKDVEHNVELPLAGRIEGSVLGAEGATLAAYVSATRKLPGARYPTSFGMPLPSDPQTERGYSISRLAPGKYTLNVRITAIPGVDKPDYKKLNALSNRAPKPTVEIRPGETTQTNITLKK